MKPTISICAAFAAITPSLIAQEQIPFPGDYSVDILTDVNGDGFPDYVTGSTNLKGAIRSGFDGSVLHNFGPLFTAPFFNGTEVSCAGIGDIDNDGVQDVAFSLPGDTYKYGDPGWAMAFSTQTGVKLWQTSGSWNSHFGRRMVAIGDVTGDGHPDLAIASIDNVYIRNGKTGAKIHTFSPGSNWFDPEIAAIGDVTGDGVPDLLVGYQLLSKGIAKIFSGSTWVEVLSLPGLAAGDALGTSVASAGDANLDGTTDILIGAPGSDLGGTNAGSVFIVSSTTGAVLGRVHGWWPGNGLGRTCASPGDIDVDGRSEVAAGTNSGPPSSQGYVLLHSSLPGSGVHLVLIGNSPGFIGSSMKAVGDINSDGKLDLAVGSTFINFVSGASTFGKGTPGCIGGHVLDVNKKPSIGTPDFEIRCSHAPNGSVGALLVSDDPDVMGSDLFGIGVLLHTGVVGATFFDAYDLNMLGNGRANVAIPIPNDPALVGARFYVQGLLHWAGGVPCSPSPLNLSSSAGLAVVIQL